MNDGVGVAIPLFDLPSRPRSLLFNVGATLGRTDYIIFKKELTDSLESTRQF